MRYLPNSIKWMRTAKPLKQSNNCLPHERNSSSFKPCKRSMPTLELPETSSIFLPAKGCNSSFRITIEGPSGMALFILAGLFNKLKRNLRSPNAYGFEFFTAHLVVVSKKIDVLLQSIFVYIVDDLK